MFDRIKRTIKNLLAVARFKEYKRFLAVVFISRTPRLYCCDFSHKKIDRNITYSKVVGLVGGKDDCWLPRGHHSVGHIERDSSPWFISILPWHHCNTVDDRTHGQAQGAA